jgi:hypothetical protein
VEVARCQVSPRLVCRQCGNLPDDRLLDDQATRGSCFCVRLPVARLPLSMTAASPAFVERSGLASR